MTSETKSATRLLPKSFQMGGVTFATSVVLGVGILISRKLVYGSADPFQDGWPLFLQATAGLVAFVVSWRWSQGVVSAIGLYVGLIAYMLIEGKPEYPVSSLIALTIHGFVPALVGSLVASAVRSRSSRLPKNRSHA
jgi:hypothetical protein